MKFSTSKLPLLITLLAVPFCKADQKDLINFGNDDTLHGKFLGFTTSGKVIWKNPHAEGNIAFSTNELNRIVFNKGELTKPFTHSSYVTMTNLDIIPGSIIKMDKQAVTLKTDFAGEVLIPNDKIRSLTFQPLGDKILYRGPYTKRGWTQHLINPAKISDEKKVQNKETKKTKIDSKDGWSFKNFSWKHTGLPSILMSDIELPDTFRYTFYMKSENTVKLNLVIFSDMNPTEEKENKDDKAKKTNTANLVTKIIGTNLSFRLSSYSSSLIFSGFDKEGKPYSKMLINLLVNRSSRSQEYGERFYDIRVDRKSNSVLLYRDKSLLGQWDISDVTENLKGNKLGYYVDYSGTKRMQKISNITLNSWNGVIDPAISIENDNRDIVMLSNGTDRFSGEVIGILDNKLELKGPYAELVIPTDQIQTLSFAKKKRAEPNTPSTGDIAVRFYGTGKITGSFSKGPDGSLFIKNPTLGKLKINYDYITSIQFSDLDFIYEIE